MTSFILTPIITLLFLIKMFLSDTGGNGSGMTDSIREGVSNAKALHDDIDDIMNSEAHTTTKNNVSNRL